ncbi:EpsG family protein [Xanthomarina sp. F1114]|uniref:EpsG family protein n=1 Tax=Xanthomarina sp. F1114 TaxID=2996019 RepID=UPI00225DFD99|nr:EpsG family protein [Xanthomarina sp. F1114]MCX7548861.1 EpsG family protein [Xanthomarina sp. F1114]
MNNQTKGFSIILYLIWPISAIFIGLRNFDCRFGRNLLVASFTFLGYTADDTGDLERYASQYYEASNNKLDYILDLFLNLQIGKFFNDFSAIIFSIFDNHHIYFAFLFGVFGYFLVNAINLLRINISSKSKLPVLVGFIAFASFYSILTIFNYAFYMGGIYFLYFLLKIIFSNHNKRKYYILICLAPLFHIGLIPALLVPFFYAIFKQRTLFYILLLVVSTSLSQSFLVNKVESGLVDSDNILDDKFRSYGSEAGRERLEDRYAGGYESGNFNYRISRDSKKWANTIGIPLLLLFLFINRKKLKEDKESLDLFNVSIACLSITSLMLNISQGERFYNISGFMVIAAYAYYIQKMSYNSLKFRSLLFISVPLIIFANILSFIMAKNFISPDFYLSNYPIKLFELL